MEKIELLEEKIRSVSNLVGSLRDKNAKVQGECERLAQENELLLSENRQVRRLMAEIDHLREERKLVKQKCERLVTQFERMKL